MGPRTGPCGNTDVTDMVEDFSFSITTVWARSDKKMPGFILGWDL